MSLLAPDPVPSRAPTPANDPFGGVDDTTGLRPGGHPSRAPLPFRTSWLPSAPAANDGDAPPIVMRRRRRVSRPDWLSATLVMGLAALIALLALAAAPAAAQDRADLDRTQIIGNRELPKVLYIVPWKKPEPGGLSGRPVKSVLDEVMAPVDRDVLRRQVDYDGQLRARGALAAAPSSATSSATSPAAEPAPK